MGAVQVVPGPGVCGVVLRFVEERREGVVFDGRVREQEQDAEDAGADGGVIPVPLGTGGH